MNIKKVLIGIAIVVILYKLYTFYFSDKSVDLINTHDARMPTVINPNDLPPGITSDYTYSIWFYINDWNYRFGETKVMYGRTDSNNNPSPAISLAPSNNDLSVTLALYPNSSQSMSQELYTCSIKDVPLQRWTNLIMSLNNRALDLYLDGKLVKTCMLPGVPKMNNLSALQISPDGGFSGFISAFKYFPYAINPSQAYDIYKQGYGGGSMFGELFNKYRVKLAFLEDNKEINSFEI